MPLSCEGFDGKQARSITRLPGKYKHDAPAALSRPAGRHLRLAIKFAFAFIGGLECHEADVISDDDGIGIARMCRFFAGTVPVPII
jgi:hypothetical protein